jgi:hypothetical protein
MKRLWILIFAAALCYAQAVVIRTSTLLDGKGHVLKNTDLVIDGGRITALRDARGKAAIDLTGMTVMLSPAPNSSLTSLLVLRASSAFSASPR